MYALLLASCAGLPDRIPEQAACIYIPADGQTLISRYAPFFVPQTIHAIHNRIGLPSVRKFEGTGKGEEVFIDPAEAVMYVDTQRFSTEKGNYTNLVYRVHFPEVPQLHLTAGKNTGLLVIVTLDSNKNPLLVTTVHTCGCYLVITPTSFLSETAYPGDWNNQKRKLWGETIPVQLGYDEKRIFDQKLVVFLRDDTHRVMDLEIAGITEVKRRYETISLRLDSISSLYSLPLPDGGKTSFFETEGWRKGFVKGSYKPWEMLLISWWALDLNVGCDKEYGDELTSESVFYTSLKPWNRQSSDMRNFAVFLQFWGWKL
ncbi:MAG: hypothetical protein V1706_07025 [Pseudomonadota bacterium]